MASEEPFTVSQLMAYLELCSPDSPVFFLSGRQLKAVPIVEVEETGPQGHAVIIWGPH